MTAFTSGRVAVAAAALASVTAASVRAAPRQPFGPPQGKPVQVRVHLQKPGRLVPQSFLGFSLEYDDAYALTAAANGRRPVFVRLLNRLARYNGPPVLRIGGNSQDRVAFNLAALKKKPWGVTAGIPRNWLRRMQATVRLTHSPLIIGLDLRSGDLPATLNWARAVHAALGRHVLAYEIGNEPDFYHGRGGINWNVKHRMRNYLAAFGRFAAALRPVVGRRVFAGPAAAGWVRGQIGRFILAEHQYLRVVTLHQYPLGAPVKNPRSPHFASVARLLAPATSQQFVALLKPALPLAHKYGLPVRFGEMNSAWGGGKPGVSDTFASSLWIIDTLFRIARAGGAGVNLHTAGVKGMAAYSFVGMPPHGLTMRPLYLGMLLFAQAVQGHARLLPVGCKTRQNVAVDAALSNSGVVRIVLVNKRMHHAVVFNIALPGNRPMQGLLLNAPSPASRGNLWYGGLRVTGTDGRLPGKPHWVRVQQKGTTYTCTLLPASAELLRAEPAVKPPSVVPAHH